jgi:hypothetical protein
MRKYKILLTNHALHDFRGSETYCYTLCKELSKYHDMYIYSPQPGRVSALMADFAEILTIPEGTYDIILFNHNNTVHPDFQSKCKIFTIHGIYPELEKPPDGMDRYVGISNEIGEYYKNLPIDVIYNGIDTEKFNFQSTNKTKRNNVLFSSNSKNTFTHLLHLASLSLGLRYKRIGRGKKRQNDVTEFLQWSDIVVGLGRTALEGLSCNKKVIVADRRFYNEVGMDGLLTADNIEGSKNFNYSGRAYKKPITFFSLRKELKKAKSDKTIWERDWILKNHNISLIAGEYISLAEKIIDSKSL